MSKKKSEKVRRKQIRENISKKSAEKNPKIPYCKFGKKIPESQEKLPGFSNPRNLRTLFQSNLPLGFSHTLTL
jgi:hypothetical protein